MEFSNLMVNLLYAADNNRRMSFKKKIHIFSESNIKQSKKFLWHILIWDFSSEKQLSGQKMSFFKMYCNIPKYWDRQACANSVDPHQIPQNVEYSIWSESILFATHPAVLFRYICT